jgi:hypothetical protein
MKARSMKAHDQFFTPTGALRAWATVALVLVSVGLLAFYVISYVNRSQRSICGIIVLIDDRNQKLPASEDPDTAQFRAELHHYRQTIGCKP